MIYLCFVFYDKIVKMFFIVWINVAYVLSIP